MPDKSITVGVKKPQAFETVIPPPMPIRSLRHRWFRVLKQVLIKARHWEYWPAFVFYAPIVPYWLWLSIKARTTFFFSAANPSIPNSGFTLASKTEIYKLIPEAYYPRTKRYAAGTELDVLRQSLAENGLHFPVMAKPDIGDRGIRVKLLHSEADLAAYCAGSKVDFLLQEFVDHANEAGIFYYRVPGEAHGHISGIVQKNYLAIVGDGFSTIEQLLQQTDRYFIRLSLFQKAYGVRLDEVLAAGASYVLPYGSHCRGAEFRDASHQADRALWQTIDQLCRQIPGFYYGRMDVKFSNWDDLRAGRNFSIIELNGASSEPAHIYDTTHSVYYAWREVCRHWRLLYQISRANAVNNGQQLMRMQEGIRMMKNHFRHLKRMK